MIRTFSASTDTFLSKKKQVLCYVMFDYFSWAFSDLYSLTARSNFSFLSFHMVIPVALSIPQEDMSLNFWSHSSLVVGKLKSFSSGILLESSLILSIHLPQNPSEISGFSDLKIFTQSAQPTFSSLQSFLKNPLLILGHWHSWY